MKPGIDEKMCWKTMIAISVLGVISNLCCAQRFPSEMLLCCVDMEIFIAIRLANSCRWLHKLASSPWQLKHNIAIIPVKQKPPHLQCYGCRNYLNFFQISPWNITISYLPVSLNNSLIYLVRSKHRYLHLRWPLHT